MNDLMKLIKMLTNQYTFPVSLKKTSPIHILDSDGKFICECWDQQVSAVIADILNYLDAIQEEKKIQYYKRNDNGDIIQYVLYDGIEVNVEPNSTEEYSLMPDYNRLKLAAQIKKATKKEQS